jgi:hypothetical protein
MCPFGLASCSETAGPLFSDFSGESRCAKLTTMSCPLCRQRQARRQCPALDRRICAVCCGTKRLIAIACPPNCGYLAAAEAHPPASVRRRQERDLGFLMAMREGLSPEQSELYWAILTFVVGFRSDPLVKVVDEDLADGAASLAATYETAGRGLIYEHRPQSLVAQRFVTELKAFLANLAAQAEGAAARRLERDAALVLRRLEAGARNVRTSLDEGQATALDMISRVVLAAARHRDQKANGQLIQPERPMLIEP